MIIFDVFLFLSVASGWLETCQDVELIQQLYLALVLAISNAISVQQGQALLSTLQRFSAEKPGLCHLPGGLSCSLRLKSESQCHSMVSITRPASTEGTQDTSFSGENTQHSTGSSTLGSLTAFDTLQEQLLIPLSTCQRECSLHTWQTLKNQSGAEHISLWAHITLYLCV